jgi:hypothetical protein
MITPISELATKIQAEQSSTAGLSRTSIPLLFVNPEFDMGFFHRHAEDRQS